MKCQMEILLVILMKLLYGVNLLFIKRLNIISDIEYLIKFLIIIIYLKILNYTNK
jgi:hypothetical protein